jgi:uncharacterized membrane protein YdjX (TVP38/TMEM64 family)
VVKKIVLLLVIITSAVWLRNSPYSELLTLEALKNNTDILKSYVQANYLTTVISYLLIYIAVAGLNIPGAVILSLSGGYLFGAYAGTLYAVTASTAGAVIGFYTARYFFGNGLNARYSVQLAKFNSELEKNGSLYMLTLRLIPVFPYFLINILAGLTTMRLGTFVRTSFLGMIPGGFVFVYAGSRLNSIEKVSDIFSPGMLLAFVLFGLLMLLPVAFKKVKGRG